MAPSVVLVTGVSRCLGGHSRRGSPPTRRSSGSSASTPCRRARDLRRRIGRTEFVRADIRNPLIAKVDRRAEVDTVVHISTVARPVGPVAASAMKETNVIGTMQLLAACQKAPSVRRVVLKSTTAVYGACPRDPALFTETMTPARPADRRVRQGRRGDRGLRARLRPAPARRRRSRCCGSPTSSGRGSTRCSPATSRCRSCRPSSATTRGCSCCTRTTRSRCSNGPSAHDLPGIVQRRRRRRPAAVPGHPPGRPGAAAVPRRRSGSVGRLLAAAPASSTSPRSSCGSSTSAAWSTPPGCATEFGFTPRYTTVAGLRRLRPRPRARPRCSGRERVDAAGRWSTAACTPRRGARGRRPGVQTAGGPRPRHPGIGARTVPPTGTAPAPGAPAGPALPPSRRPVRRPPARPPPVEPGHRRPDTAEPTEPHRAAARDAAEPGSGPTARPRSPTRWRSCAGG